MPTTEPRLEDYTARTTGPGKFEGEKPTTPYFYDLMLEDHGDEYIDAFSNVYRVFLITEQEKQLFKDFLGENDTHFVLNTDDSGFAWGKPMTTKKYEEFITAVEESYGDDDGWDF